MLLLARSIQISYIGDKRLPWHLITICRLAQLVLPDPPGHHLHHKGLLHQLLTYHTITATVSIEADRAVGEPEETSIKGAWGEVKVTLSSHQYHNHILQ